MITHVKRFMSVWPSINDKIAFIIIIIIIIIRSELILYRTRLNKDTKEKKAAKFSLDMFILQFFCDGKIELKGSEFKVN